VKKKSGGIANLDDAKAAIDIMLNLKDRPYVPPRVAIWEMTDPHVTVERLRQGFVSGDISAQVAALQSPKTPPDMVLLGLDRNNFWVRKKAIEQIVKRFQYLAIGLDPKHFGPVSGISQSIRDLPAGIPARLDIFRTLMGLEAEYY